MAGCLPQEQLIVGPSGLKAVACGGNVGGGSDFHQVSSGMFETGFSLCERDRGWPYSLQEATEAQKGFL